MAKRKEFTGGVGKMIPVDKTRCQAERRMGSFMTLGPRELVRCENIPVFVATENKPGNDGLKGSMSLCVSCAEKMKEILGEDFATIEVAQPEKNEGKEASHGKKKKV